MRLHRMQRLKFEPLIWCHKLNQTRSRAREPDHRTWKSTSPTLKSFLPPSVVSTYLWTQEQSAAVVSVTGSTRGTAAARKPGDPHCTLLKCLASTYVIVFLKLIYPLLSLLKFFYFTIRLFLLLLQIFSCTLLAEQWGFLTKHAGYAPAGAGKRPAIQSHEELSWAYGKALMHELRKGKRHSPGPCEADDKLYL